MSIASRLPVYVSGNTNEKSIGIYQYTFDTNTGALTSKGLAIESVNPTYLTVDKAGRNMYAVNEVDEYKGQKSGYVSAYTRDKKTGKLKLVNEQSSGAQGPCYASTDATGSHVFVANYNGGSASLFPVKNSGSSKSNLGEISSQIVHSKYFNATFGVPDRQEKPHVHSIDLDPVSQKYAFSNDLGCDLLVTYNFDHQNPGSLAIHSTFKFPNGTGPRHLKFSPKNNKFAYVISELSNEVFLLTFDYQKGTFKMLQQIDTLPKDFTGSNTAAEIDITPNGKFMYASMRGYDAITIFEIDEWSGKLSLVGYQPTGGKHPRHFTLDPTGNFLLVGNRDTNNVVVFKINQKTGNLTQISSVSHVQPTCVRFWD
ncbi:Lactonase, 7-bladed beta-propeller-domain-containing protein [Gilbertella persicaria]|uniref:Lactonase, 7-bladed beta-propeller-domain-containing protein n=1 Tax=Gilbertella persicaria TaxID=101096 RepID=UPI00221EA4E1|nr:Lactonase, 7-bladed beta-propeller-domain-containing protein [Gilbertella persicaria]KAI8075430.1 Lactonase, 7-bladed beta-propeller-domain-containing protein [Gilbertella persicaria]